MAGCYRAAGAEVGGDFYELFADRHGGWYLVIGDVCGRGAAAAALSSLARESVRSVPAGSRPAAVLTRLNAALLAPGGPEQFLTAICAHLVREEDGFRVVLAFGGHCPLVVVRADSRSERIKSPGLMLGVFADAPLEETVLKLGRGDIAVFFTDGVTEAKGLDGLFGYERLIAVVARQHRCSASQICEAIETALDAYADGPVYDDVAVLVLKAL